MSLDLCLVSGGDDLFIAATGPVSTLSLRQQVCAAFRYSLSSLKCLSSLVAATISTGLKVVLGKVSIMKLKAWGYENKG